MSTIRYMLLRLDRGGPPFETEYSAVPFPEPAGGCFSLTIRSGSSMGRFICGHEKVPPNFHVNIPASGLKMHYVIRGKGVYRGMPFEKNCMFMTESHSDKALVSDGDDPWEMFWCVWQGDFEKAMVSKLSGYTENRIYRLREYVRLETLFRYMIYNSHCKNTFPDTVLSLSETLLSDSVPLLAGETAESKCAVTAKAVRAYIEENVVGISVEQIAQKFNYNRRYLSTMFRRQTGITIHEAIRNAKLHRAELFLLHQPLSMDEVAAQSGYANYFTFFRAFKKKYDMTPTEFIRFHTDAEA